MFVMRLRRHIPGLQVELLQLMEDLIGDLTSVPQPIEIKLYSDDEQLLRTLAAASGRHNFESSRCC